jgi:hypothetical protein
VFFLLLGVVVLQQHVQNPLLHLEIPFSLAKFKKGPNIELFPANFFWKGKLLKRRKNRHMHTPLYTNLAPLFSPKRPSRPLPLFYLVDTNNQCYLKIIRTRLWWRTWSCLHKAFIDQGVCLLGAP